MRSERLKDNEFLEILKIVAPGTLLREGLENILRGKTGGLIVIGGDSKEVIDIVDGGFYINKDYTPSNLYELAKMDGAIILSKDLKKILYANALLIPDSKIFTNETGTRHKSAERASKQTSEIVISISQRRNIITVYKGFKKYILNETNMILARANQALQTLEKFKDALIGAINNLDLLEFEDMVTLVEVAKVIQRTEMVMRIVTEIDRYLCELGNEGRLISMQLDEILANVETDGILIIEDYMNSSINKSVEELQKQIISLSSDELMDMSVIYKILGYTGIDLEDLYISPNGYRMLNRIPRLPLGIIRKLIAKFEDFQGVLSASTKELDDVDGIGEARAKAIKTGLKRLHEQSMLDSRIQ